MTNILTKNKNDAVSIHVAAATAASERVLCVCVGFVSLFCPIRMVYWCENNSRFYFSFSYSNFRLGVTFHIG